MPKGSEMGEVVELQGLETLKAQFLKNETDLDALKKSAVERAKDQGDILIAIKKILPHGEFLPWIAANLPVGQRQCQKYIKLANANYNADLDDKSTIDKALGYVTGSTQPANYSSESNEWYTPPAYLETVRELFGGIDLDPASCEFANRVVQAREYYSLERERDGLELDWHGKVFCNPPYGTVEGKSMAGLFCQKAISEYQAGNVTDCILLVNSSHSQAWQRPLYSFPVCFVDHRIAFVDERGEVNPNPTFQNVFVYLGRDVGGFAEYFNSHGYVMLPWSNTE